MGIANRRALIAYAQQPIGPVVVALVDLNKFKPINDTYGHRVGDQVLKAVAHRLRAAVAGRGIAARLGGDEFVLIIDLADIGADIRTTANRVLTGANHIVAAPLTTGSQTFTIAASIGAGFLQEKETFTHALHRADIAMYRAKNTNTSLVFYDANIDTLTLQSGEKSNVRVRDII